jgi:hypothetical protein
VSGTESEVLILAPTISDEKFMSEPFLVNFAEGRPRSSDSGRALAVPKERTTGSYGTHGAAASGEQISALRLATQRFSPEIFYFPRE